jgi:uncharacterized protein
VGIEQLTELGKKREALEAEIAKLESVVVAFSGGVDSTLLLAVCLRVLGADAEHPPVIAVTLESALHPSAERGRAAELAEMLGAPYRLVQFDALADADVVENGAQRCYFCKRSVMQVMRSVADEVGYAHVVHGANADDLGDYRPGTRAAIEAGARAPLQDVGMTKAEIRALSRELGLPTWDAPSMACLASRFPYGTALSEEGLQRVDAAEAYIRERCGLVQLRVRDHFPIARLEIPEADMDALLDPEARAEIVARLRELGYTYVSLDLAGFRSGSMNAVLTQEVAEEWTAD